MCQDNSGLRVSHGQWQQKVLPLLADPQPKDEERTINTIQAETCQKRHGDRYNTDPFKLPLMLDVHLTRL